MLSGEQREDITDLIKGGMTPEEAIIWAKQRYRNWKNVNADDIREQGVSVFKADRDGYPIIENLQQAESLSVRLDGRAMYSVTGKTIGTGQDGEPILSDAKGERRDYNTEKMQKHLISILKENYADVRGSYDSKYGDQIYTSYDWQSKEHIYSYKGYDFRKPKSKKWGED